jgi:hypothetical protein
VIAQLPMAQERTVSTVPTNGDVNPYGIVIIPPGFAGGGILKPGDVLVSNFNASSNLQGTGSTIVRVTANNQSSVFYQGPATGVGLSTALGVLKKGFVIVGNVPSTNGMSSTAQAGSLIIVDKNGNFVTNLTSSTLLNGPWDLTINDSGNRAQIFISDVLSGTVTRADVRFTAGGFHIVDTVQIASGYTHRGDPAAFEVGPTGLVYVPKTDTLYVASTGDNAVYAIRHAGKTGTDQGTGTVIYQDATHLHGPLGLALAADGNFIASQGDAINSDPNQPSELVEFTPKGKFVGQFSLNSSQGGAFGVASSASSQHEFAAVNDITNTVQIWRVKS